MAQILHVTIPASAEIETLRQNILTSINKLVDQLNNQQQTDVLNLGFNRAVNGVTPVSPTDLVTKKYVDDLVNKLATRAKTPVGRLVATVGNGANGGGGVPLDPGTGVPTEGTPVPPGTPTVTSLPPPGDPLSVVGTRIIYNGAPYVYVAGLVGPDGYWALDVTGVPTIRDTFANMGLYTASSYAVGTVFFATDWLVSYAVQNTDIGLEWTYYNGIYEDVIANIPGILSVKDRNFTFRSSDYLHSWVWNGTVWHFTTGGFPAGYIISVLGPAYLPPGAVWHALDGTTQSISQDNGTLASVGLATVAGEYVVQ